MERIDHSSMHKINTYWNKSGYHPRKIKISLRRIIIFSMIAVVLFAAIGFWTNHAIKLSLEESYTTYLQTLLDADITALTIWMENEKRHVRSWADEPNLREQVRVLIEMGRNAPLAPEKLMTSQALVELQDTLKSVVKDKDYQGFAIVDRSGFILASTKESPYLGKYISSEFMQILEQVFQGKVILERPHLKADLIPNLKARSNQPIMLTAAPVSDETGTVLAALLFTINPDVTFLPQNTSSESHRFSRSIFFYLELGLAKTIKAKFGEGFEGLESALCRKNKTIPEFRV